MANASNSIANDLAIVLAIFPLIEPYAGRQTLEAHCPKYQTAQHKESAVCVNTDSPLARLQTAAVQQ
jgi:hypothetical protein